MSDDRRGPRRGRKQCAFCSGSIKTIDYKQPDVLLRYMNEYGRIRPRRQTGTCAKHQRELAREIKRARHIALVPFTKE